MKTYTENEILELMELPHNKRLGKDRLINFCQAAGLIIEPIEETLQGKGKTIQYKIIKNEMVLENEVWISCIYSNEYEVSNLGRVRKQKSKKLLGFKDGKGYQKVSINSNQIGIHRLIYFSFHPEDFENECYFTVDHINGIKTDNNINNLRILSNLNNIKAMKDNQDKIQSLTAQLISQYGYEETILKLTRLLN